MDLLVYQKHQSFIKKLNVFLRDHYKKFICRQGLNSYTNENALMNHEEKCGDDSICTIKNIK